MLCLYIILCVASRPGVLRTEKILSSIKISLLESALVFVSPRLCCACALLCCALPPPLFLFVFFLCALSTLLNASGGLNCYYAACVPRQIFIYTFSSIRRRRLFVCCCSVDTLWCGWYFFLYIFLILREFFFSSLHVIFLQHTRYFLGRKKKTKHNIDNVYTCVVRRASLSHPFFAGGHNKQNIWEKKEIYECEIILGNKHKSFQCVFFYYFSRFCRTTPDFGSLRHIKKSSTVLLLFLNPLC